MNKISHHQVILMGATFILSATLVTVPAQAAVYARQHTYLALIVASLIILPPVFLMSKVAARFPGQNIFQALAERFSLLGKIIIGFYVLFFFLILVRDIRMLMDFVDIVLLPDTPIFISAILLILAVWYIGRGGVEAMGRFTEVYFPVMTMSVLFIPLLLAREFDPILIMPYKEINLPGVLKGSWFFVAYLGEVIAVFFLFSHITFRVRYGIFSLLIGTGMLFILVLSSQLILGTNMLPRLFYPSYELVRHLKVTDFLDRFDLPLVGIWMPTIIAKIAYSLYIVCYGIQTIIPDTSSKMLTTPFAALAYVCSFLFFRDTVQLMNLNKTWPVFALIFELALPILLFFILKPEKEQGLNA
ncbi:spore gernimation protein [Bacillus canaveralius]|uniref:Spore gernimation protein n=1 Tax=Bacillus canaveralius TaxID=1403243 RepID=A0A2N5GHH5_9BACI|nr:endospore germination permease [Bacillus canaveralius]PLR80180.1 spore gernimation protein [Bacillus canaveralius]PLR98677.1 spore gernimation protein [Bacillus canaveralius]RSK48177.1 spore gernimation protein [Bacillus canaveralius]